MAIHMTEYINGVLTKGGSGLKVNVKSLLQNQTAFLDVADVRDHFNGTYIITYPLITHCAVVSVILEYVHFNAYKGPSVNIAALVYNKTICSEEETGEVVQPAGSGWYTSDVAGLVYSANGRVYPSHELQSTCHQLRQYERIVTAGASHMQFLHNFYTQTCDNYHQFEHKYFRYVHLLSDIVAEFMRTTRSQEGTSLAFIVQSGTWNLCYPTSLSVVLTIELNRYIAALQKLLQYAQSREGFIHIHMITTPARDHRQSHLRSCNNYVLAIFNDLLKQRVGRLRQQLGNATKKVAIRVTDMFEMTLPVSGQTEDKVHYLDCHHPSTHCHGRIGEALGQLILERLVQPH
jgi:hypothetical protein